MGEKIKLTKRTKLMVEWFYRWALHDRDYQKKTFLKWESTEIHIDVVLHKLEETIITNSYFVHDKQLLSMLREHYYKNLQGVFNDLK